ALVLAERLLVDLAGLRLGCAELVLERLQPRDEDFALQHHVTTVDAGEQLPFLHSVALDHGELGDPSRDAARNRDDLAIDARVVEVDVGPTIVNPVRAQRDDNEDAGADQPKLAGPGEAHALAQ